MNSIPIDPLTNLPQLAENERWNITPAAFGSRYFTDQGYPGGLDVRLERFVRRTKRVNARWYEFWRPAFTEVPDDNWVIDKSRTTADLTPEGVLKAAVKLYQDREQVRRDQRSIEALVGIYPPKRLED